MSAATRRTVGVTLFVGALMLSTLPAQAAVGVVRVVIAGASEPEELHQRIRDLMGPLQEVRPETTATTEIAPADLFGPGDRSAAPPVVWILVSDGAARIRAVDGSRQLFVFRDLVVATPLTELDRERIAQVANAALAAVLDGRPGALDRAAAARLLGAEPPRPPPPPVAVPAAVAPPPLPPAPLPGRREKRWVGSVSYEVQTSGRALFQGPGLTAGVLVMGEAHPMTIALQGQTYLPVVLQEGTLYQYVLRLLVTLRLGRWVEAGLGGGIKYTGAEGGFVPATGTGGVSLNGGGNYGPRSLATPSGRLLVRGGPLALGGVRLSGMLSADLDRSLNTFWDWFQPPPSRFRPGIALELWWH